MSPIQSTEQAAFQASATGRVRTWNADCQKILGYPSGEVLHRCITRLLATPEKKECKDRLAEYRTTSGSLQTVGMHADGRRLDLWLRFIPQFRQKGRFDGYTVIVESIEPTDPMPGPLASFRNHFEKLLDCLAGTFYIIDQSGRVLMWNTRLEKACKMSGDEVRASHVLDFFKAQEKPMVQKKIQEAFEQGDTSVEADLLAKDGTSTPYLFSGVRIKIDGRLYLCGMGLDMSRQKQQEELLRLCYRAFLASGNGILITHNEGKDNPIVYLNPAFERITGYRASEAIGRDSRFMAAPGLDEDERRKLRLALNECRETHVVFRNLRKNGELFWNDLTIAPVQSTGGEVTHFIGIINDVTASKQQAFLLEHEASHDALTGLTNRNLLMDRLEQALYSAKRNKGLVAIIFIDLDGFKAINDTEGHDIGDEVLRVISKRLKSSVRENDTVARFGGDEFVLILTNQPSLRFALGMIERLHQSIAKPVLAGAKELNVGASIGVSIFPHDGSSGDALLQAADAAMYQAKATGRNNVQFFSFEMKSAAEAKQELENSLRNAIDNDELFLMFQPRVCLKTEKIVGAEALLRWRHPERGILAPASFMSLAEESGLIIPLGEWVLDNACSMLERLQDRGFGDFAMSLNVSLKEFSRRDYVSLLDQKLSASGMAPERLEIEIAESNLMHNPQHSINVLTALSRLGVKLAIDDFGTGFSSVSYLQKFSVSHLEIDRSFIADICTKGADATLTKTVIAMGHNLDIGVVAKGVETSEQLDILKRYSCDQIQGNYFSGPVCPTELERLLKTKVTLGL